MVALAKVIENVDAYTEALGNDDGKGRAVKRASFDGGCWLRGERRQNHTLN